MLKYWAKIISGELSDNSYVTKVYKALLALEITKPREVTWVTLVRDLLVRCGMGDYWQTQRVECRRTFERLAKSRVYECYIREWKVNVESSTDGRLFKFIKDDFKFERYLNINNRSLNLLVRISRYFKTSKICSDIFANVNTGYLKSRCTLIAKSYAKS